MAEYSITKIKLPNGDVCLLPSGDTGPQGPAGAAAGFGTPTATVDANTGTPSVTVTSSGPDTAKVFAFDFKNLKGAKGDKGDPASNLITGVKGNAESSYRTGNINITLANIGAKGTQSAVSDPTASGTSVTFIDSISQNAQGVITPTKKTVRSASSTQSGLMSAEDKTKLDGMGMISYGTCATAATAQVKAVTISNSNWQLKGGSVIGVKFSNTNTYSATASAPCQLNVNSTGAKAIYWSNTSAPTGTNTTAFGFANRYTYYMYDGTYWVFMGVSAEFNDNTVPSAYCTTTAGTAAKAATCSGYVLLAKSFLHVVITAANTAASALTLNVNNKGAKPIYINGSASSSSNYALPAGSYLVYYNGTNYYFRTDGKLTADITGNATNVTGTVAVANGGTGATTTAGALSNLGIKYKTVTVTTSARGNMSLSLSASRYWVISAFPTTNDYSATVHVYSNGWMARVFNVGSTSYSVVANKSVTVRVAYIDFTSITF